MPPLTVRLVLEVVTTIGTVCSLFFYLFSLAAVQRYITDRHAKAASPDVGKALPPVSILKPLKGVDPEMWESLCSHCEQNYPLFQIIFGVRDPADPAIELVRRLEAHYPNLPIELIVCERLLGTNIKVSNLSQMLAAAQHDHVLVNDADIRVPPDYLRKVLSPLADPSIGMVTCLYSGIAAPTVGSRLEALGISADFVPGVLCAKLLDRGLQFGLGSTLAFRRQDLKAAGGFEALLDYLADDYELGRRIAATGKRVELSTASVTTSLPAYSFSAFFQHQLRWSRTIRDARGGGYRGLIFTFGLPWAIAMLVASSGEVWAWCLFAVTIAARVASAFTASLWVLGDKQILRYLALLPLKDLIAPVIWVASFAGNRIHWRGDVFNLKDGRLTIAKR